jgi:hypothetical protein
MKYEESMKNTYNEYYNKEHAKFANNIGFALILGSIWSVYPITKIMLQAVGENIRDAILKPDTINKIYDEIIGIMAGLILGPKYLSQFVVKESKVGTTLAKDMLSSKTENELITDIIAGVKKEDNKYKQYEKLKKEEEEFNVLMNRKNIDNVKMKYEKMKRLAEFEKTAKEFKNTKFSNERVYNGSSSGPSDPKKIAIGVVDDKKLLTNLIEHEDIIANKSDKFIKKLDKDSFAKGAQIGMIVNSSYDINIDKEKKRYDTKKKIHKVLCSLSLKSRNIGEITSQSITTFMALSYIFKKLSVISVGHYIQYIGRSPNNISDLCSFVSASSRVKKS